jgi:hypothetical protein
LIDGLLELFERFRSSDGFIEGRVLKGAGGTTVVSYLCMRSAADQQGLDEQPAIQAGLETLRQIARPHRDLFELVWVFTTFRRTAGFPLAWVVLVRSAGEESSVSAAQGVDSDESLVRKISHFGR